MASNNGARFCSTKVIIFVSASIFLIASCIAILLRHGEIDPIVFEISPPQAIAASVKVSENLSKLKKIHLGKYTAPESIAVVNGSIYTGVDEAKVLKINESGVFEFAVLHPLNCKSVPECGRPAGIRLAPDGQHLIIADAYLGLFSVSVDNGEVKKLFPLTDDFKVTFLNDFDFLPNGSVILSETSVKYSIHHFLHDLMEGRPNGRLLVVDLETGKWHQMLDNLYFPSGVQIHSDGKSVLVVEATTCRVLKIPLDGGSPSVFVDGLIGTPDNIRPSPRGGYWIPVANLRDSWMVKFGDWAAQYPSVRAVVLKLSLLPMFKFIELTTSSALLRYDQNGILVEAILDPENKLPNVLEATEADDQVYTSSYFLPYIGQVQV